ncbi:MAG: 4Fe-4S dicluster domain-containing protein [Chloroflexi bacterium]|nr:4Fe-4S dicluster domain-containing protein [Chloroflexota bacterium]
MLSAPGEAANLAALQGYLDVGRVAIDMAAHIRHLGWDAKAVTTMASAELLHIPLAIKAGLGELGKSGLLITREFGANVRLAAVLTNLPVTLDSPADIGIADFCALCQLCVKQCPAGAISLEKQMVRGIQKWVTDIGKCAPYFVEHHACGICLEICPWTEHGPRISEMMLHRRSLPPIEERLAVQGLQRGSSVVKP